MKKFLSTATWSLLAFLFVPTSLILASWNAIPGDALYPVKIGLEKTLLLITPSTLWQSSLQVNYTERRFEEASQLLAANYSSILAAESLQKLNSQVSVASNTIDTVTSPEKKVELANQYIATLNKVSTKLVEKRAQSGGSVQITTQQGGTQVQQQTTQPPSQPSQNQPVQQVQQPQQTQQVPTTTQPAVTQQITQPTTPPTQQTQTAQQPSVLVQTSQAAQTAQTTALITNTEQNIAETIKHMEDVKKEAEKKVSEQRDQEKNRNEKKDEEKKDREKGK